MMQRINEFTNNSRVCCDIAQLIFFFFCTFLQVLLTLQNTAMFRKFRFEQRILITLEKMMKKMFFQFL